MKLQTRFAATAALMVLMLPVTGCEKLKARDQLTKGVAAFKNGQYEQATVFFQNSINLDPTYQMAKLYLATAYSSQVVPNDESPANLKLAQQAIDSFQQVLNNNPQDKIALQQIATINRNIKHYKEAKEYEQKVIQVDPNDAEANYTIGVVDWIEAYKNATELLAKDGVKDNGDGNPKMSKATCEKIKDLNGSLVSDGLDHLNRAVQINPTYDDAMQYLSLTYRRQADLSCGDDAARKQSVASAEDWMSKAMGARKINEQKKEEKATKGSVTQ